jgi:hypothetical protein
VSCGVSSPPLAHWLSLIFGPLPNRMSSVTPDVRTATGRFELCRGNAADESNSGYRPRVRVISRYYRVRCGH